MTDPFARHRADSIADGGFFTDLDHHAISHTPGDGTRLVVAFDNLASLRETDHRQPWGMGFLRAQGWDVLGVMAKRKDWFRCPLTIQALENLRDTGFFARFGAVSMFGASMGAYGALAFAPLAPGCTVLAFAPQSSLAPDLAPFEDRYRWGRNLGDWTGAYRDAVAGVAAASRAYVLYDPHVRQDNAHAARLMGPNVVSLAMPHVGHKLPPALLKMRLLQPVSVAALTGTLTPQGFASLYRARRTSLPWRVRLLERALARGHLNNGARLTEQLRAAEDHRFLRQMTRKFRQAKKAALTAEPAP